MITEVYLEFNERSRAAESTRYMRTLSGKLLKYYIFNNTYLYSGQCISLDATFKIANKAVVVDKNKARHRVGGGGVLTVINEFSEILLWVSVISTVQQHYLNICW